MDAAPPKMVDAAAKAGSFLLDASLKASNNQIATVVYLLQAIGEHLREHRGKIYVVVGACFVQLLHDGLEVLRCQKYLCLVFRSLCCATKPLVLHAAGASPRGLTYI